MKPRILIIAAFAFIVLLVCWIIYYYIQTINSSLLDDKIAEDWAYFADYLSGTLNPLFALTNIFAVLYVGFTLDRIQVERKKEESRLQKNENEEKQALERRSNAIRLVDQIQSLQFYKEISAPCWEIMIKWRHWIGPEGTEYRFSVVSGHIHYQQNDFGSPSERSQFGHNLIRFNHHFHPSDYVIPESRGKIAPEYVQSVLSEHQALSYWLEYWGNAYTMIAAGLVDEDLVRKLLADWYGYWLELIAELRLILENFHEEKIATDLPSGKISEQLPNWIYETKALELSFYSGSKSEWYARVIDRCKERAESIKQEIDPLMQERIKKTLRRNEMKAD